MRKAGDAAQRPALVSSGYCLGRIPLWRGEFHASSSFGAVADGGGGCVCRARARCGNGAPLRCHSRYPAPREYTDPPGRLVAPSYSDESSSQVTFETSCRPMTADHATADCGCFLAWAASTSLRSKKGDHRAALLDVLTAALLLPVHEQIRHRATSGSGSGGGAATARRRILTLAPRNLQGEIRRPKVSRRPRMPPARAQPSPSERAWLSEQAWPWFWGDPWRSIRRP